MMQLPAFKWDEIVTMAKRSGNDELMEAMFEHNAELIMKEEEFQYIVANWIRNSQYMIAQAPLSMVTVLQGLINVAFFFGTVYAYSDKVRLESYMDFFDNRGKEDEENKEDN